MNHRFLACMLGACMLQSLAVSSVSADDSAGDAWRNWLAGQVDAHPDVIAARDALHANLATADQLDQPIYNPQLQGNYDRLDSRKDWRVGIGQTIDWNRRRGAQQEQAVALRANARQSFASTWQDKAAQIISAMVVKQAARERYDIALEQQAQLDTLVALIEQREQVGDLGQIDVQLSRLSLSRRLNGTAKALAAFQSARASLFELLPNWDDSRAQVPPGFWPVDTPGYEEEWLDRNPAVLAAKARWETLAKAAEVAHRQRKPEPTFVLEGGREEDGDVFGVSVSIPLTFRNNYDDQVRAARQTALAARAEYKAAARRARFAMDSATTVAKEYRAQFERWQQIAGNSRDLSGDLLARQWEQGDLSTYLYLDALEQRFEGYFASIDLTESYRLSLVAWLHATSQIGAHLGRVDTQTSEL